MARVKIKPKMVDVGRGPEPAQIPYREAGVTKVLPRDGMAVDMDGASGSYWRRRLAEGSVELVDAPKAEPKAKAKTEGN